MNVLVSGASGFIGSQLIPALLSRGHYVVCMTRDPARVTRKFPRSINVVEADALRPETLERLFVGIDVAYYLIHSLGAGEGVFVRPTAWPLAISLKPRREPAFSGSFIWVG